MTRQEAREAADIRRQQARNLVAELMAHWSPETRDGLLDGAVVELVERAILAAEQRGLERAAKVADRWAGLDVEQSARIMAEDISEDIRALATKEQP